MVIKITVAVCVVDTQLYKKATTLCSCPTNNFKKPGFEMENFGLVFQHTEVYEAMVDIVCLYFYGECLLCL